MIRKMLLAFACAAHWSGSALASDTTSVSGIVLGHDGNPPLHAHVHVLRPASHAPMVTERVGDKGDYRIDFAADGLLILRFTGVDHQMLDVPVLIEEPMEVVLDVRLRPYPYTGFLDPVWVIGDFNRFSRLRNPEPMEKQPDGRYSVTIAVDADTLAYQLLGVEAWGRSINGTQSDRYEYDGAGDYRSVVAAADSVITITFDPRLLILSETAPRISYHPQHDLTALNDAYRQLEERRRVHQYRHDLKDQAIVMEAFGQEDLAAWFTGRLATLPSEALEAEQDFVLEQARGADTRDSRDMLYVYRLGLELLGEGEPDPAVVQEVLANVPPVSPFWSLEPDALGAFRFAGPTAQPYRYLDILTAGHSDPYVRQAGFASAVLLAELSEEFVTARSYWELWRSDSAAVTDEYLLQLLAPDRRVKPGNPLPEFEAASIDDSSRTYRPEYFAGRLLLIDFWATWCPPCAGEMPTLHDVFERYHDRGLEILSVSFDRSIEDIPAFRQRWGMPWHHTYADGGFGSELAKAFEVRGIPKPVLVDENGVIVACGSLLRGRDLDRTLRKVLGP